MAPSGLETLLAWKCLMCSAHVVARAAWPVAQAYEMRGAGAVLHSHSLNAVLASLLDEHSNEFSVTHLEMIKV